MENNFSVNAASGQTFKTNEKKQDPQLDQLILGGPGVIPRQPLQASSEQETAEKSEKPQAVVDAPPAADQVSLGKEVSRRITAPGAAQGSEAREGAAASANAAEARTAFAPAVTAFVQNAEGTTDAIDTTDTFTRGGLQPAESTFRPAQTSQLNGPRQNARKSAVPELPEGALTAPVDGRGLAVGLQEFLSSAVEKPDFAQTATALGVQDTEAFAETVKMGNALATFNQIDAAKISLINAQGEPIASDQISANVGVKLVIPPVVSEASTSSEASQASRTPPPAPQKPVEAPQLPPSPPVREAVAPPEVREIAQNLGVADAGALAKALESGNADQLDALIDPTSLNVAERQSRKLNAESVQGPVTPTVEPVKAVDENKVRGTNLAAKKLEENIDPLLAQIRNPIGEQIKKAQIAPSPAEAQPQPQDAQAVTA
jgi:hypothetical protein